MSARSKKEVAPHVGIPLGPHIEEYLIKPLFDDDGVQVTSGIGQDGKEYPDPVPMSPPIGYTPPSDMLQMLEQLFQRGKAVLEAAEVETEEEANDFEVEDDPLDALTPYERVFDPPAAPPAPPASSSATVLQPGAASAAAASAKDITAAAAGGSQTPPPPAAVTT